MTKSYSDSLNAHKYICILLIITTFTFIRKENILFFFKGEIFQLLLHSGKVQNSPQGGKSHSFAQYDTGLKEKALG